MKLKPTFKPVKLEKPWPSSYSDPVKEYGLEEWVEGKLVKTYGAQYSFDAYATLADATKAAAEKNEKIYLNYYSNDELLEYFNSIDFEPVFKKIRKITGLKNLTFTKKLKLNREGCYQYFEIESEQNIAETNKLIRAAWKDFRVCTFGASLYITEDNRLSLWCNFDYSYEHQDGGHNGAKILRASLNKKGKWELFSEEEIRLKNEKDSLQWTQSAI